jgi:hypothetical protein
MSRQASGMRQLKSGDKVFIRANPRSPCGGRIGTVVEINHDDLYGAVLVRFSDGLRFRYTWSELLPLALLPSYLSHSSGRVA